MIAKGPPMLFKGDRVLTQRGYGTVVYVRMAAPDFVRPAAVSVLLDSQRERPGYSGTSFHARDVLPVIEDIEPSKPHFNGTAPHRFEAGVCVYCGEKAP